MKVPHEPKTLSTQEWTERVAVLKKETQKLLRLTRDVLRRKPGNSLRCKGAA